MATVTAERTLLEEARTLLAEATCNSLDPDVRLEWVRAWAALDRRIADLLAEDYE